MQKDQINIQLKELEPGDKVTGLSLGHADFTPLKTFLQKDAKSFHSNDLGKTYCVFVAEPTHRLVGYITLVCGDISIEHDLPAVEEVNFKYPSFPAVKIARLAVDARYRGRGIGELLVRFALGIVKNEICPRIGCRFVVLDAKVRSVDYYLKRGFTFLDTDENRARTDPIMFIDLRKIGAAEPEASAANAAI